MKKSIITVLAILSCLSVNTMAEEKTLNLNCFNKEFFCEILNNLCCKPIFPQCSPQETTCTEPTTQATTYIEPTTQATTYIEPTTQATTYIEPTTQATTYIEPTTQATTYIEPTTQATTYAEPTTQATTYIEPTTQATTYAEPTTQITTNNTLSQAEEVVKYVNEERAKYSLNPLSLSKDLSRVAQIKSEDMRDSNYFDHNSPNYGSPFDMLKQFGISYNTAGENIAKGQKNAKAVVDAWMNSEGHRKNILNEKFTEIGVGYSTGNNTTYWTQLFTG